MRNRLAVVFLGLGTLAILPAASFARSAAPSRQDKSAEVRTLTGCLSKGDGAHEYKLTADNGSTWEIRSKTVKLSPHVGHTVTLTGKVRNAELHGAKEKVKEEAKEHGVDKDATEHGHLNVTSLSMVSESCKK
jgi:hypothetical protein